MPQTLEYYGATGSVETIVETNYSNKSKLQSTMQYTFDVNGMLLSRVATNAEGESSSIEYCYAESGRLENVVWPGILSFTPEYNEFGDLVKVTYITGEYEDYQSGFISEYTYNSDGRLASESNFYLESDGFTIDYSYENGVLSQIKEYDLGEVIQSDCDENGNVVKTQVIDDFSGKVTSTVTFEYKYDDHGNWIEKTEKEKKKVKSIVKREITYFESAPASAASSAAASLAQYDLDYASYGESNFISDYLDDISYRRAQTNAPGRVLFTILIICSVILTVAGFAVCKDFLFKNFTGTVQPNGMKKLWMYNSEPYVKVGTMILIALAAFVASIIIILLVGGVIWGLLWLVKILLWIIIIVGWICLIFGGLAAIAKEPIGCLPLIIGILIVCYQDGIEATGEALVEWGFEFMQSVNMFGWGLGIFVNYWDVLLLIFFAPMALFLAVALVVITINMILNGIEFVVTRIYSIRRPCPICGSTDVPDYIIGGKPHPVKLHPGIYGVFTHTSPVTGKEIPTMLMNGRGKITRKCKKCNSFINADTESTIGTEIHIGIVGHRSSGKSYLLFSGLAALMRAYPDRLSQIDADSDTKIEIKKKRIDARDGIQTNVANKYRAIQLILKSKMRPVPYHLFFYDVAGEKFNAASSSHKTAMDFYRNVQSIVFVVDPSMLDIAGTPASPKFEKWHKRYANAETYKLDGSFAVLKDILETVGRKAGKIDFNFVCTKSDMGYFAELGYAQTLTEEDIERFLITELGLSNLVNSAKASFKSVRFFTSSALESDEKLRSLFVTLLEQRKVTL